MNGYALWAFGDIVETEIGRARLIAIFVIGGLFASVASFVIGLQNVPGVGASGAIFAVFGVFFAYAWRRRELAFYAARIRSVVVLIVINVMLAFQISAIDWRRPRRRASSRGIIVGLAVGRFRRPASGSTATFVGAGCCSSPWRLGVVTHGAALRALGSGPPAASGRGRRWRGVGVGDPVEVALPRPDVEPAVPHGRRRLDAVAEVQIPPSVGWRVGSVTSQA